MFAINLKHFVIMYFLFLTICILSLFGEQTVNMIEKNYLQARTLISKFSCYIINFSRAYVFSMLILSVYLLTCK